MSMVAIGVAGLAISAGATAYSIASAPGAPKQPDLASANKAVSDANAQLLPIRRQLEAAAHQGGKVTLNIPSTVTRQYVRLPVIGAITGGKGSAGGLQWKEVPYVPEEWAEGGKYARWGHPMVFDKKVSSPTSTYDFTGMSDADVQGTVAKAMADAQLHLSQKYDSQFIDEALAEERLADPEGFAARDKQRELIQQQIDNPVGHPVNDLLDQQIGEQLKAAGSGHLMTGDRQQLDASIAAALKARGGGSGAGLDFEAPLVTGFAGENRRNAAITKSNAWEAGGQTPEDVDYRREQQNLSNLSATITGATPQSQFGSLSGAQRGPTPVTPGGALPTLPGDNGAGGNAAATRYGQQVSQLNNQVGGWTTGITSALNIANLAGSAGWKPFQSSSTS